MERALNYLALARKAGLAELGEEPVGAITRAGKGYLVVVASDASDHTWRRAKSFVAGTQQQVIRLPFTKEQMGFVTGRSALAIAALTDPAMALALVESLNRPQMDQAVVEALTEKVNRMRQRQKEAKAHQHNKRFGKKK